MNRLTIKAGTTTEYKDGSEITENIYYQNVDELMKEFEKQKSEFKNPNITEDDIMKFAEKSQNSKRIQKLGQYEDIDEDPKHLADIKKALEIIKNKQVQVAILLLSNSCAGYNMTRGLLGEYLEQEEYDFLKEVLL